MGWMEKIGQLLHVRDLIAMTDEQKRRNLFTINSFDLNVNILQELLSYYEHLPMSTKTPFERQ